MKPYSEHVIHSCQFLSYTAPSKLSLVVSAANISETITDEVAGGASGEALAWCVRAGERVQLAAKDLQPHAEKLEKFVEDVK